MKTSQLIENLELKLITKADYDDREIKGCYIGDLLSWVMSKAKADDVWITVQTNINVVAVAALTEVSCIIVPEDIEVEHSTIDKANQKDIIILGASLDSFNLAVKISKLLFL